MLVHAEGGSAEGRHHFLSPGGTAQYVARRLSVCWQEGIEVHHRGDALSQLFRHARDHHAAVGVADQHDAIEILPFDLARDIVDLGAEVDGIARQVRALADSGKRGRHDIVAAGREPVGYASPAPAPMPGAMDQQVSGAFRGGVRRCRVRRRRGQSAGGGDSRRRSDELASGQGGLRGYTHGASP